MFDQLKNLSEEYANRAFVSGAESLIADWTQQSKDFRRARPGLVQSIAYGSFERCQIDVMRAGSAGISSLGVNDAGDTNARTDGAKGTVVFVHGGYWVAMSKDDFTFLSNGPLANGWNVAIVGYCLAPQATIETITRQVGDAVLKVADLVPNGPLRLVGHSAGGHLAAMCMVQGQLPAATLARIDQVMSISGVHDLRCLPDEYASKIAPDRSMLARFSPVLLTPAANTNFTAWVGGAERSEFLRQSRVLTDIWLGLGARTRMIVARNRNHFDVVNDLFDPNSALTQTLLQPMPINDTSV